MSYYELSRLLGTAESLHAQYERAKEKQNDDVARELLKDLECTLAKIDRQTASTPSPGSDSNEAGVDGSAHIEDAPNPFRAVLYMWVGGFWVWTVATCLGDQYQVVKALMTSLHLH